jgi:hypothetical protein
MSANDNAMTRFLFAILKQKCLKDVGALQLLRNGFMIADFGGDILRSTGTKWLATRSWFKKFRMGMPHE